VVRCRGGGRGGETVSGSTWNARGFICARERGGGSMPGGGQPARYLRACLGPGLGASSAVGGCIGKGGGGQGCPDPPRSRRALPPSTQRHLRRTRPRSLRTLPRRAISQPPACLHTTLGPPRPRTRRTLSFNSGFQIDVGWSLVASFPNIHQADPPPPPQVRPLGRRGHPRGCQFRGLAGQAPRAARL
jgi:hypothetical protein